MDRKWFVLLTEPQMERKAAAHLIGWRIKCYLPEIAEWKRRGVRRIKTEVRKPMFRGYLFVHLSLDQEPWELGAARAAPGVHNFLRNGDYYMFVPNFEMERIVRVEQDLVIPKDLHGPAAIFHKGEHVRVGEGAFSGLSGEIASLDDDERITVLLSMLGRVCKVQLAAEMVDKL